VHPDLPVHFAHSADKSLILLGYLLDPHRPDESDGVVLQRLLETYCARGELGDLIEATGDLNGRWILIAKAGQDVQLLHDAVGLRQVYYKRDAESGSVEWCASQPSLLAEVVPVPIENGRLEQLVGISSRTDGHYWWPAGLSAHPDVNLLLANHSLDLSSGVASRYWPDRALPSLTFDEGIEEAAAILRGTMAAASRRYNLALAVTSGLDSRMLVAAARDIREGLICFTQLYWEETENDADAAVASQLAKRLGLDHRIIASPRTMSGDLAAVFERNVLGARPAYAPGTQGVLDGLPDSVMCVYGSIAEVARRYYHPAADPASNTPPSRGGITAELLADTAHFRHDELALASLNEWLASVHGDEHHVDLLDLFYWEHRVGSWLAMTQSERDIAQEVLMPFNCRRLLTVFLSVDKKYRSKPGYLLFHRLIKTMWPELLKEPINPHRKPPGLGRRIVRRLRSQFQTGRSRQPA
jgi:hypothetical protein